MLDSVPIFTPMKGEYSGGHGMHFVGGKRPISQWELRKLKKRDPQLWKLAGEALHPKIPHHIIAARIAARQKLADEKTAYMHLSDDEPLTGRK